MDAETISALVMDTVASAQRFGMEAGVGRLGTLMVEFDGLSLLLVPFEQDLLLALVARPTTFVVGHEVAAGNPTD